jgi:predicted lysophospholipase L1 biosynthesis ABC-type transport system permease subunit
MRSLKLATYRPGMVRHFVAPYKVLRLPGVWLVSLWYAGLVGLIVILSLVGTQLVAAPPYLWGKNVGLINIGGLIGTFLGCVSNTTASVNLMLTKRSRPTPTSSQIGLPNALRRKTLMVSQSQSLVLSLLFQHSSSLLLAL